MNIGVAVDGTGPLADAELRFGQSFLSGTEEGWNHEQSFVPFGMGLFCVEKRKRPLRFDRQDMDQK
ncbi:hypothetical protein AC739_02585 [Planococcus glaciei]|uniref:hypothetical protein n=1 Tax=Planococcus glaciei TaxID=459472 RepID=UPI0003DF4723|nr:hypothetical protein [Planococcus glaciei]ETP69332.1 hypothetical protein G159_07530 [Planococcus glaciei CHR43]KOF11719.1 hypothetical protein AC739_02585 [Planococcus glaciei]QDY46203.1 hypothetical protein FK545_15025 [Planococcus glaciei]